MREWTIKFKYKGKNKRPHSMTRGFASTAKIEYVKNDFLMILTDDYNKSRESIIILDLFLA